MQLWLSLLPGPRVLPLQGWGSVKLLRWVGVGTHRGWGIGSVHSGCLDITLVV